MKRNRPVLILIGLMINVLYARINSNSNVVVKADNEVVVTGTAPADTNLANATSGCPEYRRFNNNGLAQRCSTLSTIGIPARTEELLQSYGLNNYNEREVIGRLHNIKTEMLVCISYADTSIGNFMKSENNIGNVGNNDRGQTVRYNSLLKGIDAMGRVLNNKYLGQYQEVRQLAGSSNTAGPNYATELTNGNRSNNWITNVLNCLSLINDGKITGGYKFRR